ncbi:hypothetical protein AZE42_07013 [Rhizopogon vesiculosus]|uniref:Uncharacterized protein n=1 Tax=Rhizopogon vesiculosus TaxID=180088 RepID=A0A1J8RG55_9AGAM|nr:hypothetical protein AZE42_07013 [Rhizopogon vesiculosus]
MRPPSIPPCSYYPKAPSRLLAASHNAPTTQMCPPLVSSKRSAMHALLPPKDAFPPPPIIPLCSYHHDVLFLVFTASHYSGVVFCALAA